MHWGRHDPILKSEWAAFVDEHFDHAEVTFCETAGHFVHVEVARRGGRGVCRLLRLRLDRRRADLTCNNRKNPAVARRVFLDLSRCRAAQAASSAMSSLSPSTSPSAASTTSPLPARRGDLASWPSIFFSASVSVTSSTTAISRVMRSTAAS